MEGAAGVAEGGGVMTLTQTRLKEVVNYNAETGLFTWKTKPNRRIVVGAIAGAADGRYCYLRIDGRSHLAHRCVFLYMTGAWPNLDIDHINGDRFDNRWANLREVSRSVNMQNLRSAMATSKTGLLGVCLNGKRFSAAIRVDGAYKYLGNFKTPEAAHAAYVIAKRQFHEGCTI